MSTTTKAVTRWTEPAGCSSARGWLFVHESCRGFYLDYSPGSYRPGHDADFCRPGFHCRDCDFGDVLAERYPDGSGSAHTTKWVHTAADARRFIEQG